MEGFRGASLASRSLATERAMALLSAKFTNILDLILERALARKFALPRAKSIPVTVSDRLDQTKPDPNARRN